MKPLNLKKLSQREYSNLMNTLAKAMRTHRRFVEIISAESDGRISQFTVKQKNEFNKRILRFENSERIYNAVVL